MSIPDNYSRWQQHDDECEEWLASRPLCDWCGKRIQDDFLFNIDGTLFHAECAELEFKKPTEDFLDA